MIRKHPDPAWERAFFGFVRMRRDGRAFGHVVLATNQAEAEALVRGSLDVNGNHEPIERVDFVGVVGPDANATGEHCKLYEKACAEAQAIDPDARPGDFILQKDAFDKELESLAEFKLADLEANERGSA